MTIDDLLQKNRELKHLHVGKRCFIIGNGPSLAIQNTMQLLDEITIVVSSFFRHPEARTIHPKYWVLADPEFWTKPDKHFFPLLDITSQKSVDIKLFVPTWGSSFFSTINTGPLIDLHFFHYDQGKDIRSSIDFTTGVPQYGQNVIGICLMLAFYLGCNPIYFIGCDQDYMKVSEEQYRTLEIKHFYNDQKEHKEELSMNWEQFCHAKQRMYYEYDQLKQYASLWGYDVYNATAGGYFDTFPRIQYESLFVRSVDLLGSRERHATKPEAMHLAQNAVKLMNEGADGSALELLESALRRNLNTREKVDGLEYLMALCLSKLGVYDRAMIYAREDLTRNVGNREKAALLIEQLKNYL